ncbi:MAG TPA: SDR family NAD(P)-dependent oxidoreductase [Solirubrobacteraceae bacterium]
MTQILENKKAIVTGGAKGIGLAIAKALADAGATVVIADIDGTAAESAAAGIDRATGVVCDVREEAQVQQLVADNADLDVFVSNAGIAAIKPLVEMSFDEWREVLSVNLDGVFLCTKHAGAAMAANGGGSIVNIASIKAFGGSPVTGHYGAAKAGVVSLSKTAALELRDHGVRVNAVCPGWIGTDMVGDRKAEFKAVVGVEIDDLITQLQGRYGTPEEIAPLVVWLASDRARFASGTAYIADGGATASIP